MRASTPTQVDIGFVIRSPRRALAGSTLGYTGENQHARTTGVACDLRRYLTCDVHARNPAPVRCGPPKGLFSRALSRKWLRRAGVTSHQPSFQPIVRQTSLWTICWPVRPFRGLRRGREVAMGPASRSAVRPRRRAITPPRLPNLRASQTATSTRRFSQPGPPFATQSARMAATNARAADNTSSPPAILRAWSLPPDPRDDRVGGRVHLQVAVGQRSDAKGEERDQHQVLLPIAVRSRSTSGRRIGLSGTRCLWRRSRQAWLWTNPIASGSVTSPGDRGHPPRRRSTGLAGLPDRRVAARPAGHQSWRAHQAAALT